MKPHLSTASLFHNVKPTHGDFALLAFSFTTGLLDCSTFNNFNVFVGMQTGNTVILCLSTAGMPVKQPYAYAETLVSLASFCLGGFATFRLSSLFGPMKRLTLTLNLLAQGFLIILAAALASASLTPTDNHGSNQDSTLSNIRILTIIPLLAFQSGAQIVTSRILGYNEIPVNVLTSTYADLAGDKDLFKLHNIKRDRRLAAVFLVLSGAFCATWIMRRGPGIKLCLWLTAGVKVLVALLAHLFMEPIEEEPKPAL